MLNPVDMIRSDIRSQTVVAPVLVTSFGYDRNRAFQKLLWRSSKHLIDKTLAVACLPLLALTALFLLLANPVANPGPLFFRQWRMGQDGRPFVLWKFRSMAPAAGPDRGHLDGMEENRVTPLGRVMRRLRLDELPNILNILAGDMSVVGPRPDMFAHACAYADSVPVYARRFAVKPGMTGLAQVRSGYAETLEAVEAKANWDAQYVQWASTRLDLHILWQTLAIVVTGRGAK